MVKSINHPSLSVLFIKIETVPKYNMLFIISVIQKLFQRHCKASHMYDYATAALYNPPKAPNKRRLVLYELQYIETVYSID